MKKLVVHAVVGAEISWLEAVKGVAIIEAILDDAFDGINREAFGVVLEDDGAAWFEGVNDVVINLIGVFCAASVARGNVPVEVGETFFGDGFYEARHNAAVVVAANGV